MSNVYVKGGSGVDSLNFRKWLKEYGYTYEEYVNLEDEKKKEIEKRFKTENTGNAFKSFGQGLQGCGCILMLIPVLAILIFIIYTAITM